MSDPREPQSGSTPSDETETEAAGTPDAPADEPMAVPERFRVKNTAAEPVATITGGTTTTPAEPEPAAIEHAGGVPHVELIAAVPAETIGRRQVRQKPRRPSTLTPLGSYAVVETGGKQYRVSVGDTVSVEKLVAEAGSELTFDRVLLVAGDGSVRVGTPTVSGAAVTARVDDHYRGEKIIVFKYKPKKRYRRRLGHRQSLTRLTITGITG